MTVRLTIIVLLLMFFGLGSYGKKVQPIASRWQNQPLKIDGSADDWEQLPRFYDSGVKLSYDISNDGRYLYVVLKAVDRDLQTKILRNGFNVWIDTTGGKKKETYGIRFPLPVAERMIQAPKQEHQHAPGQVPGQKSEMIEMRKSFIKNIQEMDIIRLADGKSARTTSHNSYGVNASLNIDSTGVLIYEAAIPFHSIFADTTLSVLATKKIMVTLNTNKVEVAQKPRGEGNEGGGGGGGMGGGGMGGMGGGGGMRGGGMGGMGGGGGGMRGGGGGGNFGGGNMNNDAMDKQVDISKLLILATGANDNKP